MPRTPPGVTLMVMLWHRWLETIRQRIRGRWALVIESFALRHQIAVLQHSLNTTSVLPTSGSPGMGSLVSLLARLVRQSAHCPARDCPTLAQARLQIYLAPEVCRSLAWRKASCCPGASRPNFSHEPGEPPLGCAAHSRRATEARFHRLPIDGIPYFAKPTSKTISKLDHVPAQSTGRDANGKP